MNVDIKATVGGDFTFSGAGILTVPTIETTRIKDLDIGEAVAALRRGRKVARKGWNGKGMQLELQVPDAHSKMTEPYAYLVTVSGSRIPWTCSQSDLLAQDWEIVS